MRGPRRRPYRCNVEDLRALRSRLALDGRRLVRHGLIVAELIASLPPHGAELQGGQHIPRKEQRCAPDFEAALPGAVSKPTCAYQRPSTFAPRVFSTALPAGVNTTVPSSRLGSFARTSEASLSAPTSRFAASTWDGVCSERTCVAISRWLCRARSAELRLAGAFFKWLVSMLASQTASIST